MARWDDERSKAEQGARQPASALAQERLRKMIFRNPGRAGYTVHVRVFLDGRPANGFEYSVDLPVAVDYQQWTGLSAVQTLIDSAKNDIVSGSWEKIQEFFKSQR